VQDNEKNLIEFHRLVLEEQDNVNPRFQFHNIHCVKKTMYNGEYKMQINRPSIVEGHGPVITYVKVSEMSAAELEIARKWCFNEIRLSEELK